MKKCTQLKKYLKYAKMPPAIFKSLPCAPNAAIQLRWTKCSLFVPP